MTTPDGSDDGGRASPRASDSAQRGFGPAVAIALVIGTITGVGVFNLPTSLAAYGPIGLVSMGLTTVGALVPVGLWLPAWVNLAGARRRGPVQVVTTVLKFVALAFMATVGLFFVDGANYGPAVLSLVSPPAGPGACSPPQVRPTPACTRPRACPSDSSTAVCSRRSWPGRSAGRCGPGGLASSPPWSTSPPRSSPCRPSRPILAISVGLDFGRHGRRGGRPRSTGTTTAER
ncbi:hypothetical protein ACIRBY_15420 [Streptomyces sp. NPDC096136]|uniref:hypothetical protein n=1 Tax=Streptomyces sp. NPDC096136 TaxID=3366076 RepID=UPI003829EF20